VVAEAVGEATGAATGFAAALLGRLCGDGHALWCLRRGDLYAPGLTAFGIDPARLLVVRVERADQALWVLEEALASGRFAAVLGETAADLTASRRLQLAARDHGTTCLLLDRGDATTAGGAATAGGATTALTRWQLDAVPGAASLGGGPAAAGWRVTLARCRGGAAPRHWTIGWCHETCDFVVAAALADRPSVPARPVAWPPLSRGPEARRAG
jgi:protein ImuA